MPALTGNIKDAAGRPAKGAVRIKALHVREGSGGAVIDERTFDLPILDGTITGSPVLEPGPAKITLNVYGWRLDPIQGTYTTDEPNHHLALQLAGGYRIVEPEEAP
jgi:hypothetical protein